jgi:hypothetical protein
MGREERWLWAVDVKGSEEDAEEARAALAVDGVGNIEFAEVGEAPVSLIGTLGVVEVVEVAVLEAVATSVGVALGVEVTADGASPSVVNIESDTAAVDTGVLLVTMVVKSVLVLVVGDTDAAVEAGLDAGVKLNEQFFEKIIAASPLASVVGVLIRVQISVVFPPNL